MKFSGNSYYFNLEEDSKEVYSDFNHQTNKGDNYNLAQLRDIEYSKGNKRNQDQKGSKSARRVSAKSIGGDKSANHDLSGFKNGKTNRTAKSSKHNEAEIQNSQYQDAKVRYNNLAYDGNSKNSMKEEYKQLVKNVKSKQDAIHNDRDYSEYMENGNIDNRNSGEDQFNIHQINIKDKGKFKQKAPLKIGKLKQQFQINNSNRNQKLRVKSSNSQVNNYKSNMNCIEISDDSEENNDSNDQINDLEPASEQTDKRRVHTDFDRHHSNDKYVPMGNMIKQNMFKNPKEDKIKNKIKSRRRSNFDFEMDNSSNNGDDLIMNAEDQITYEHEQMLFNNPSYPDIIEGKFKLTHLHR